MTPQSHVSPYVGLRPFREADSPFFFGRQRDIRVIASNLISSPLTVLYGPSGVGKSSVLQAGVVPHIRKDSAAGILYFNEWQDDSFLASLMRRWENLRAGGSGKVLLLLDQFEEYLLYHSNDAVQDEFESILARTVNRDDGATRILIGIREDALFRLDERMSLRIPNLLENTLQLKHLNAAAAREAIEEPVRVLNERVQTNGERYSIEPALVDALLDEIKPGRGTVPDTGWRIETAFLQLVLSRIWAETTLGESHVMSARTLQELGGVSNIVHSHVNRVMDSLTEEQRDVASRIFGYMVTPSGTKIVQSFEDLVTFGEAPEAVMRGVLSALSESSESRILRRLSNPERYELFHDVLARPLLDWRRAIIEDRKSREARRELDKARRAARRLWSLVAALLVVLLLAIGAAGYAFVEKRKLDAALKAAGNAEQTATIAERNAQARASDLEAARAEASGQTARAKELEAEARKFRSQADTLQAQAKAATTDSLLSKFGGKVSDLEAQAAQMQVKDLQARLNASGQDLEAEKSRRVAAESQVSYLQARLNPALSPTHKASDVFDNPADGLRYVFIPPGSFMMGCSPGDTECQNDEKPPHAEQIANGFWLGQTEVTQAAWKKVKGNNPSQSKWDRLPVEAVDWNQATDYCKRIGGRLPTEKEWEYAARAGTTGARYGALAAVAWYDGNSEGHPHAVATKAANAWGIQDMSGNVWEWVEDCWHESFNGAPTDGSAWIAGNCDFHVLRGGSWNFSALFARTGARYWGRPSDRSNFFGFRVVRMVVR